jgi:GNAT superfamily N-acetyltransferase
MRELRPRPDLAQLRRQAKELLRGAQAGEDDALERMRRVSMPTTLAGAQLALAREHGFASWTRLKHEVEQRTSATPASFVIRYVRSVNELRSLWRAVTAILGDADIERPHWHVFDDFEADRTVMLVAEHDGRIVGGTIRLKLVAVEPWARGIRLGTRLVQTVEAELLSLGKGLGTHADPENKGFFMKLGYTEHGKSKRHMYKGAPLSARLLERRLALWRQRAGDLEEGVVVEVDPATGRIPPLPW